MPLAPHRAICCLLVAFAACRGQTPEDFFRRGGADFRGTAPETRLYWKPHIERSHRRILEAADFAAGRTAATVLGAGVAAEIPLAELARRFDRLVLVDLDGPSLLESLQQVPLALRPKVELRVTDVTSFAGALMQRMDEEIEASSTQEEALHRLQKLFENLKLGLPAPLPPSDLVISSLLLSEIPRFPFAYASRLVRARFNADLRSWSGYNQAFEKLVSLSIEDHIRLLAALRREGGTIYFSDTLARGPLWSNVTAEARAAFEAALLPGFQSLGLARSPAGLGAAIESLCEAERPFDTEIAAFERLLAACRQSAGNAFEPLLPVAEIQRRAKERGLSLIGAPESWWWLAYPCEIAKGPGAFYVTSWILSRAP
ncbi:MAG: hypothetical protein KIT09_09070 [Bryobacteraceae bacterium]|nr:hypothetical protein [Bryobacteraceae bacterium]